MKTFALGTVVLLLAVSFAGMLVLAQDAQGVLPRAGGKPPWPTFHGDAARTGNTSDPGPATNHLLWSNDTGSYSYSSPAIAREKVYIPADDGNVYCFWANNGTQIWKAALSYPAWAAPAVDVPNDRVFVCDGAALYSSAGHSLYCLNASTGAQNWKKALPDYGESSPLLYGDWVIVGAGDGYTGHLSNNLYCFDGANGNQKWATPQAGSCASPALSDGRLFSAGNNNLRCLDPATGDFLWNASVNVGYGSPSVADGVVFYPGGNGHIYAFNASTGSKLWEKATGKPSSYSTCAISNGSLYVSGSTSPLSGGGSVVLRMNASDGSIDWTYPIAAPDGSWGAPAVSGQYVYFGYGTTVACVNASDGALVWSYIGAAGGSAYGIGSSPSIAAGNLYIGGAESKLYCIGLGAPNKPPAAVTLQPPTEVRETSMVLGWSQNTESDFARYELHQSLLPNFVPGPQTIVANLTQAGQVSKNVTGLNYSTRYYFKVRVWDGGFPPMFNDSNEVEGTTATPNGAPSAVTMFPATEIAPFSLRLSWSVNGDNDFARYEVHRGTAAAFMPLPSTLVTTITDVNQNSTLASNLRPWTTYFFKVRVYDNGTPALRNDSNELEVLTGNTAPSAVALYPPQMGSTSADLTWSASADDDFARYEVHFSQNSGFVPDNASLAARINVVGTTGYTVQSLQLARTYYFIVRVVDQGGLFNDSNNVTGLTMNTVPKPVISSPQDGDVYDTRTPVDFNGSASSDQDGDPLSFTWTSNVDGFLSSKLTFTALLSQGSHRITLYVNDGHGHNVSARISITVNKAPDRTPSVSVVFPPENAQLAGMVTFNGTASDPDGDGTVAAVEVKIDKGDWNGADGTAGWSFGWNTSKAANGKHKVYFRAYDGELYSPEVAVNVVVDNIVINRRPSVLITGPSAAKAFSGTVIMTGTASDPDGTVARVEMSIDGAGWSPVTGAASWSYSLDTTTLKNGHHAIQVRAYDGTDFSDGAWLNFTVNNAAPSSSSGPSMTLIGGIIAVVLIAVIAAVFLMRRKKGPEAPTVPASAPSTVTPEELGMETPPTALSAQEQASAPPSYSAYYQQPGSEAPPEAVPVPDETTEGAQGGEGRSGLG